MRTSHLRPLSRTLACTAVLSLLGACASTTPHYDERFGQSVRQIRQAQVLHPDAAEQAEPTQGLDGSAAREAMQRYRHSFKEPPPVVNVINIGGSSGGGGR